MGASKNKVTKPEQFIKIIPTKAKKFTSRLVKTKIRQK